MSIEHMTKSQFSQEYPDIVAAGEPIAVTRHGLVEGYWIPAPKLKPEIIEQINRKEVQWHAE